MSVPADLKPDGRGATFLKGVTKSFILGPTEDELAVEAARLLDLIEELRAIVAAEGVVIKDGRGKRTHPAQVELRHAREQLRKTLATLRIPDGEVDGEDEGGES